MEISEFQQRIKANFFHKDKSRGEVKTFMWLVEEIGELSSALLQKDRQNQSEELADVVAWVFSLANILEIDMAQVLAEKYPEKCSSCMSSPCSCIKK